MNTGSMAKTLIVLLAVPFSAVGAIWFLYLAGYNMSIAVWVGLIALLGIDAETGVFMLLYLDLAYDQARREGRLNTIARSAGSDRARRRQAFAAEIHDVRDDLRRPVSDHVGDGRRLRCDETHRSTHDRRNLYLFRA